MKRIMLAASAAIAISIGPVGADAQRGVRGSRNGMESGGVEGVLRLRERLELTDEQVVQLQELRASALEQRKTRAAEMVDLESQARAGELERSALRDRMVEQRETLRLQRTQQQERLGEILSEEQRARVEAMRPRGNAGRRGVRGGRFEGQRRGARGSRGRGISRGQGSRGGRGHTRPRRRRPIG